MVLSDPLLFLTIKVCFSYNNTYLYDIVSPRGKFTFSKIDSQKV